MQVSAPRNSTLLEFNGPREGGTISQMTNFAALFTAAGDLIRLLPRLAELQVYDNSAPADPLRPAPETRFNNAHGGWFRASGRVDWTKFLNGQRPIMAKALKLDKPP